MAKMGKKYMECVGLIDKSKLYDVDDDIDIEAAAVKIDDLLEGVDTE